MNSFPNYPSSSPFKSQSLSSSQFGSRPPLPHHRLPPTADATAFTPKITVNPILSSMCFSLRAGRQGEIEGRPPESAQGSQGGAHLPSSLLLLQLAILPLEVAGSGSKSNEEDEEDVEKAMRQMCGLRNGEDDADSLEPVRSESAQFLGFCC